jgi:HlyD family secretion protein
MAKKTPNHQSLSSEKDKDQAVPEKIHAKTFNWVKSHKLVLGIGLITLVTIFLILRPKIKAWVEGPESKYETAKVKKRDLQKTVSASGEIEAEQQVTLKFQTSGLLNWVGIKEGDRVQKWQAIASLDKRELRKDLKKKLLAYMEERWDFEQTQEDYNIGGRTIEVVPNLTDAEKRILEKAQFNLDSAVIDVEIKDLADKLATIVSPINGIVTNIESPIAGVNITPATAEFMIANPDQMKFVANVDETDIGQIRLGQKVIVVLDAYSDEEIEGEVIKIAFASTTTSGGGTAFPVEITLPENAEEKFKVGMNGDAEIIVEEKKDVLYLPLGAIKEKDDQPYVEVIEGKKIKTITVVTGLSTDTRTEVISGLEEGQKVITGKKREK